MAARFRAVFLAITSGLESLRTPRKSGANRAERAQSYELLWLDAFEKIPVIGEAVRRFEVVQIESPALVADKLKDFFHRRAFIGKAPEPIRKVSPPVHSTGRFVILHITDQAASVQPARRKINGNGGKLDNNLRRARQGVEPFFEFSPELRTQQAFHLILDRNVEVTARLHQFRRAAERLPHSAGVLECPPRIDNIEGAQPRGEIAIQDGGPVHLPIRGRAR